MRPIGPLAGHETTATTLAWTFSLLAQNPKWETAFHDEIDRVFNGETPTVEAFRDALASGEFPEAAAARAALAQLEDPAAASP